MGPMRLNRNSRESGNRTSLARKRSDLRSFALNSIQHGLEGGLAETALYAALFVVRKSLTESLGAIVEGITKRLVDTLDGIPAGHEHLQS